MASPRALNYKRILQSKISSTDATWKYSLPGLPSLPDHIPTESDNQIIIKLLSFGSNGISLTFNQQKLNRILSLDRPSKFCAVSFTSFQLIENEVHKTADYIEKFLLTGIQINGVLYKCFGWSNSQLRSRSCLLYSFGPNETPMGKLNKLGNFDDINTIGKKSKRIGLLFSEAELGLHLPQDRCRDISDIEVGDHNFSDGCGLMSLNFARRIARQKQIRFHEEPYIPSVIQIRYRGYKGVLMINPDLKMDGDVHFRKSMRKFAGCPDDTLSVLEYSKPYTFGKLNGELVTLLSSLGIQDDVFLRKQREYFDMITQASEDPVKAFIFLSYMGDQASADRVVLNGIESANTALKREQTHAWAKMFDKKDTERVHFMIPESRLLLGICDPTGTLNSNECHVRITIEGGGIRSLDGGNIIVARNPCLHPGDIRKLHVKYVKGFERLVDCIVFSTKGRVPQPSMMSGGDLDGDKFFVCWDKDLIPRKVHEPHTYPAAKEKPKHTISHNDLIRYFAHWSTASMGFISNLYSDWVKAEPDGARSKACLQLNHLYSLSVDGERVNVPKWLKNPPQRPQGMEDFILIKLSGKVSELKSTIRFGFRTGIESLNVELINFLVAADEICLDEFELFQLVDSWSRKNNVDMAQFIYHFDFGSFTADQRVWIRTWSRLCGIEFDSLLKNGLIQSTILTQDDIRPYGLDSPRLHWRRLYSSNIDNESAFFARLAWALEDFTRKLIVLDIGGETGFKIGILVSRPISPITEREETIVDDTVTTFPFLRPGLSTSGRRTCTKMGYRIGWDGTVFQLFNSTRGNTFIWFRKRQNDAHGPLGPVSIALDRFSNNVARNVGQVLRTPVSSAEIYVISNRDRVGQELLDISHANVPTENIIPRFVNIPQEYSLVGIENIDWSLYTPIVRKVVEERRWGLLSEANLTELEHIGDICAWVQNFDWMLRLIRWYFEQPHYDLEKPLTHLLNSTPRLCVLIAELSREGRFADVWIALVHSLTFPKVFLTALIQSANFAPGLAASLFKTILENPVLLIDDCFNFIFSIALTVRSSLVAMELITIIHDYMQHSFANDQSDKEHLFRLARNVSLDYCAEADEACKCDEWGYILRDTCECMVDSIEKVESEEIIVTANVRVDLKVSFRIGDHVRLKAASAPRNAPFRKARTIDGIVRSTRGELRIKLMEPPPPERCSWYIFRAGNTTTAAAMIDAISSMVLKRNCGVYSLLFSSAVSDSSAPSPVGPVEITGLGLNASQCQAVSESAQKDLTLIWGPPGTGKTTTIVRIIDQWRRSLEDGERILVSASTNNAVDNVLEKYISEDRPTDGIVRVSTEYGSLSRAVVRFWVGAFVDGDIHNTSAMREAERKASEAKIIFTTCTGAALGLLRRLDFKYVVVDECSQITEPNCLIPLTKGCQKAVLVGDHVQLRPTVTPTGKAYAHDVSLFERLYTRPTTNLRVAKVMLDTQYRMHPQIAIFPSTQFYDGRLLSDVATESHVVTETNFDWKGSLVKFVPAPGLPDGRESFYHGSKSNQSQADVCKTILSSLQQSSSPEPGLCKMSVAILTPYAAQIKLLQPLERLANSNTISSVIVATIDSFQGREADIVVFCTVRCNANCNIGFLADERRMNVALTRARRGLIVVGDKETLVGSEEGGRFWKAWFQSLV